MYKNYKITGLRIEYRPNNMSFGGIVPPTPFNMEPIQSSTEMNRFGAYPV
jgi:hypothetical protein